MPSGKTVLVGNDHKREIKGLGSIPIILNNGKYKHIHKVLHTLEMAKNLLSSQEFRKNGLSIFLAKTKFIENKKETRLQIFVMLMVFLRLVNIQ
jgi:hypothetical protein